MYDLVFKNLYTFMYAARDCQFLYLSYSHDEASKNTAVIKSIVALPQYRRLFGIEIDGGMWTGGHTRGPGLEKDYEKQNLAQMNGYRILRFTNRQVQNGNAKEALKDLLALYL